MIPAQLNFHCVYFFTIFHTAVVALAHIGPSQIHYSLNTVSILNYSQTMVQRKLHDHDIRTIIINEYSTYIYNAHIP